MAIVLDWKKRLGYASNPFQNIVFKPVRSHITGLEQQQEIITLFLIKKQPFGTITGEPGSGKTTLLHWVQEELGRDMRPHYVDGKSAHTYSELFQALLPLTMASIKERLGRFSFVKKKLGKRLEVSRAEEERKLIEKLGKRNHVLLIDNPSDMKAEAFELLKTVIEKTNVHVILADTHDALKKLPVLGHDTLKVRLPSYTKDTLTEILQKRIELVAQSSGTFPFDQAELNHLIKEAGGNPAKLFALAKERAIELSLKATPPAPTQQPVVKTKGGGFFKIQIQKGGKPLPEQVRKDRLTVEQDEELTGLEEALEQTAKKPEEKPPVEERIMDDATALAELVIEPSVEKKKPAKLDKVVKQVAKTKKTTRKKK